jgi:hypothetical protein
MEMFVYFSHVGFCAGAVVLLYIEFQAYNTPRKLVNHNVQSPTICTVRVWDPVTQ